MIGSDAGSRDSDRWGSKRMRGVSFEPASTAASVRGNSIFSNACVQASILATMESRHPTTPVRTVRTHLRNDPEDLSGTALEAERFSLTLR